MTAAVAQNPVWADRLPAWSLFAAVLSGAGLPIYIYAPKYYADTFGVSLAALGAVLFGLRLIDVVQDPVLGWVAERIRRGRRVAIFSGSVLLALSMLGLFAVTPPIAPLWWFGITITGLFTAFSFLTICFYGQGVTKAGSGGGGHIRLAAWRETGALLGVCIAAVTPTLLIGFVAAPFAVFAVGFAALALMAGIWMLPEWTAPVRAEATPMGAILRDDTARRLLILALVNAAPVAVSSTLFLFYVESVLAAPGSEGGLLVLFFLCAALSAPLWSALAARYGAKPVLLVAMSLAVASFGVTFTLGAGDANLFAIICILSGATIGADLTLLPAMFARRMSIVAPNGGQGFGLWSLVSKFTLAFAAVTVLPLLQASGFEAGERNSDTALSMLAALYALVPVVLKLVSIALLMRLDITSGETR